MLDDYEDRFVWHLQVTTAFLLGFGLGVAVSTAAFRWFGW